MREILGLIEAEGPIPVSRYMALCLGHPTHGYYATRDPFGAKGDFTTAPEISQMFGELIGLWCAEVWRMMGEPAKVALIELGPGRGTLMSDLLRAASALPAFREAIEVTLVETSPTLRAAQEMTLAGKGVRWASTVEEALSPTRHPGRSEAQSRDRPQDEAPHPESDPGSAAHAAVRDDAKPLPAIVVSNEFFDALPVRQFVTYADGWRERMVGLDAQGALAFGLSSEPVDFTPLRRHAERLEVCPEGVSIAARIASHVAAHSGAMLAIDYGADAPGEDTLQAVRAHRFADPLEAPGEADLTTHVDFSALAAAAKAKGAAPMRLISQADFLERLGLSARAERLAARATPDQREAISAAVTRLTDRAPTGMGAMFKAFAFAAPGLNALPAFEPA